MRLRSRTSPLGRRDLETLFGGPMPELEGELPSSQPESTQAAEQNVGHLPDLIEDLLKVHGQLTNHSVRVALDCSSYKARRHLKLWVKAGLLIRRGRRQNTRYILA